MGLSRTLSVARQYFTRAIITPYNLLLIQCNSARDYDTNDPELWLTATRRWATPRQTERDAGGVLRIWEGWKSGKHWHASALEEIVAYLVAMVVGFSAATIAAAVVGLF